MKAKKIKIKNHRRGFSLIELIIAIGVLAIGLVGILQIFPIGLRASRSAGMFTKATFLAQNKLEEIKMAGFDAVAKEPPDIALSGEQDDFDWQVLIDKIEPEGVDNPENMRKVTVRISWVENNRIRAKDFMVYVTR